MEAKQLLDTSNIKELCLCLVFPTVNTMMYFLASQAVVVIVTFNMQAEHGSVILSTIETLNADVHMAFLIVSEIAKIVVIESSFSKQTILGYKEVNSLLRAPQ